MRRIRRKHCADGAGRYPRGSTYFRRGPAERRAAWFDPLYARQPDLMKVIPQPQRKTCEGRRSPGGIWRASVPRPIHSDEASPWAVGSISLDVDGKLHGSRIN